MSEKFNKLATELLSNIIGTILIFVIGFVIASVILCNTIVDLKYATDIDYAPLYQVEQNIRNDFDSVYTFSNTDIDITDSNIIVAIHGDDCYLKTYFDKSKTYQRTEKIDTTDPIWLSIIILIVISAVGSVAFYLLIVLILVIIDIIQDKLINSKNTK